MALCISDLLCDMLPGRSNKIVRRTDLAVLKKTIPPAVLVECGFISNSEDAAIMDGAPDSIAQEIYYGIVNYTNERENRNG